MPRTTSAKKALRQNIVRRKRNIKTKNTYRQAVKGLRKATIAKDWDKAKEKLPQVYQVLDKAVKKGVLKKNTASRLKSRLTKKLKTA